MITIDEKDHYLSFDADEGLTAFLEPFLRLRGGILLDPGVAAPWSCDATRCRERMGRNLCCKVDTRCRHLIRDKCSIHDEKPFSCALFPLDLWRVSGKRVLLSAANPLPYQNGWSRYDRDMLRCFEGIEGEGASMVEVQEEVLGRVFTVAELEMIRKAVEELRTQSAPGT